MGKILKHWRIVAATSLSIVFVVGAYVLARGVGSPPTAEASTESALLKAIASKDSDGDGLPDWEEALYGTDSHQADTFSLGMTDGEAVSRGLIVPKAVADAVATSTSTPVTVGNVDYAEYGLTPPIEGTLTDIFAKTFFTFYVAALEQSGGELSDLQVERVVDQTLGALEHSATPMPDYRALAGLTVSGSGPDALRSFAVAAEAVFRQHAAASTETDLEYFRRAVEEGDATAAAHLAELARSYQASAAGLAVLPVPEEIASVDLEIVNSIMRLGRIYGDLARVDDDPITAILAIKQYRAAELAAERAFRDIAATYQAAGITLAPGEPGAAFVNLMSDVTAAQRAQQRP